MAQKPHIPFVEFPLDTLDLIKLMPLIMQATLELGRYDGTLKSILNPHILLSPIMSNEAILSSRIEGTIASLTEVLEYDVNKTADDSRINDIKEIHNYKNALLYVEDSIKSREISMSLIKELHKILTEDVRGGERTPGEIRTTQNYIGKIRDSIEKARFIPPAPEVLPVSLDNFEKFIVGEFINPLLQLAIIHAQFEILHPFNDGNGRLGRILIPLFLFEKDIIQSPSFYISEFFEKNDAEYRDSLLAITENDDWQGWCKFFLMGLIEQSKENNQKAVSIIKLEKEMKNKFISATQSKYAHVSLDAFFKRPIISSTDFIEYTKINSRETGNSILEKLREEGLIQIQQESSGSRPTTYVMQSLIDIVDGRLQD